VSLKAANIINRKIFLGGATLLLVTTLFNGCYKDVIVPLPPPVVKGEVSFSEDVQSIFDASCNSPDLAEVI
jgi:hypothetical protein